jgi:hypothetical protein
VTLGFLSVTVIDFGGEQVGIRKHSITCGAIGESDNQCMSANLRTRC